MALAKRIIPTILFRGDVMVKGHQFNSWRSVGSVHQAARIYAMRGIDELVLLDIGATPEGRGPDFALVEKLTDGNFCPVTVGGGVRTVEDVKLLLRAGADKVCVKTAYWSIPEFTRAFGSQAIVAAVDYIDKERDGALRACMAMEQGGAGEILLTSIDREGMMEGYDLDLIRAVSEAVSIPVIAHGGCGAYQHMFEAIQAGASAVAAGAMFQFTDQTPKGAAEYLASKGIEVRL